MKSLVAIRHEYSAHSMLWVIIFTAVFALAILIDVAALLQYVGVVSGLPARILEVGSAATALTIVPLVVMGMSISSDLQHKR